MPRIIHFEIPADDPERAAGFYEAVFGWRFQRWSGPEEYWLIVTGAPEEPGIDGGLVRRRLPGQSVSNTLAVKSIDTYAERIEAHGGRIILPRTAVPSVGWIAYFQDSEGNVSGMWEKDPNAA